MKVYDCFQFYNELDILEIRLNEMNSEVDYFVIVEAELTHQCKDKPLYFKENKNKFKPFLDKIIHVIVDADQFYKPNTTPHWAHDNDQLQRRMTTKGIVDASDDDLIIISDLDEIVSCDKLKNLKQNYDGQSYIFEQNHYYWYLNTRANGYLWGNAGIATKKTIDKIGTQTFKSNKTSNSYPKIKNAGWHFSCIGSAENIKNKLDNFAHTEFAHITLENLKYYRENLMDVVGRTDEGIDLVVDHINTLPVYVQQNIDKFRDFIR